MADTRCGLVTFFLANVVESLLPASRMLRVSHAWPCWVLSVCSEAHHAASLPFFKILRSCPYKSEQTQDTAIYIRSTNPLSPSLVLRISSHCHLKPIVSLTRDYEPDRLTHPSYENIKSNSWKTIMLTFTAHIEPSNFFSYRSYAC